MKKLTVVLIFILTGCKPEFPRDVKSLLPILVPFQFGAASSAFTAYYRLKFKVTGLDGSLQISLNSGEEIRTVTSSGSYEFDRRIAEGKEYTVQTIVNPYRQICRAIPVSGIMNSASSVEIQCNYNLIGSIGMTVVDGAPGTTTEARAMALIGTDVYISGMTNMSLHGQPKIGNWDAYIAKYDKDGNFIWLRQMGVAGQDSNALALTTDGTYLYPTGYTGGNLNGAILNGASDGFIIKMDQAGNVLWTKLFGAAGAGTSFTKVHYRNGYLYALGQSNGNFYGNTASGGTTDTVVLKADINGNPIWARQYGVAGFSTTANSVFSDSSGIYLTYDSQGTINGLPHIGLNDLFVSKLDENGNTVWNNSYGALPSKSVFASSVTVYNSSVYISAKSSGSVDGNALNGLFDHLLIKTDLSGNKLFIKQTGSSGSKVYPGWVQPFSGRIIATGYADTDLNGIHKTGTADLFMLQYDESGSLLETKLFGSPGTTSVDHAAASDGRILYIAGSTDGTFNGKTAPGPTNILVFSVF